MLTVDARVWINAFSPTEVGHSDSVSLLHKIKSGSISVVMPALVLVEVAGSLSRNRSLPDDALGYATSIAELANVRLVPVDDQLARRAATLAVLHRLRGADAVYAAVAAEHGCILVSLDREHLTSLTGVVVAQTPATTNLAL